MLEAFLLPSGTREECSFSLFLINIVVEVPAKAIRQKKKKKKKVKDIQIGWEEMKLFLFTHDMIVYVENLERSIKNTCN